jgi:5-methylcytosine-specific restriction endonuclease McrA
MCGRCYFAWRHDATCFDGLRQRALMRDGRQCTVCGAHDCIVVHHRRAGVNLLRFLATLCRRCHARVHRLARAYFGMGVQFRKLWEEQHPCQGEQLELELVNCGAPLAPDLVQGELWSVAA